MKNTAQKNEKKEVKTIENVKKDENNKDANKTSDFSFESALAFCKAFSLYDSTESQCKACSSENQAMYDACQYFSALKSEKAKKEKKSVSNREIDFFDNSLTSNAHAINDCLLFNRMSIKEIAEKAKTKESRVNSHLSYLKAKQSHKVRIIRENKQVYVLLKKDFEKIFNENFLKVCEKK